MKFIDAYTDKEYTLKELKEEYNTFSRCYFRYVSFTVYFYYVILDTIAKRNDLHIINYNPAETKRYLKRIERKIFDDIKGEVQ